MSNEDRSGGNSGESHDPAIERAARLLRAPEHFDDGFEASLVAAIRADRSPERTASRRRPLSPAWWSAPWLRLSPIAGLGIAASLAALVAFGTRALSAPTVIAPTLPATVAAAEPVHDTVTYVRFVFVGRAKSVALVGDFNGWARTPMRLASAGSGNAWTASVPLPNGRHEYAFIVDGRKWVADPYAPASSDEFEANSSIIRIGD